LANNVDDATALAVGANVAGFLGKDAIAALNAIERALSCNPSSAIAYYFGGTLYAWSGDPVTGTAYAHRALRLSPFDQLTFQAHLALGFAAFHEERYDEAASWLAKCAEANPDFGGFVMGQAEALALAGRMDEARSALARAMKLEPGISIRSTRELGFAPAIEAKFVQAARLLGVPEK
jgi:Flp pilus assembly protein TadD